MQRLSLLITIFFWILCFPPPSKHTFINAHNFSHDFSTPQGTILVLEDAYKENNIEKAVRCKDFAAEAVYMIDSDSKLSVFSSDSCLSILSKTLETAYRAESKQTGFSNPDDLVKTEFALDTVPDTLKRNDYCYVIERCTYTNSDIVDQTILMKKSVNNEWKMVHAF